jgi:Tol biopolymer transport system component
MAAGAARGPALRLTTGLNAHTISLSADGRRLAWADLRIESNAWSIPIPARGQVSTATATQHTHGSQFVEAVDFSSDGRWLYYDSDLSGNSDIYRMALPAGAPERLTSDPADDFFPSPSPNGREVAFHSWRGGSRDIWVMPLDGGPVQRITSSPAQEAIASWHPDGNRLAYCLFTGDGGIWTVRRVDGVWQKPVERLDHGFFPVWSPDGRSLSFSSSLQDGSLWVMPADSGRPRLVADSVGPPAMRSNGARWSADGRSLYTRNQAGGVTGFWSIPLDGSPPRRVVDFEPNGPVPTRGGWGAAAGRLAYSASEQRSDVWVMEVRTP